MLLDFKVGIAAFMEHQPRHGSENSLTSRIDHDPLIFSGSKSNFISNFQTSVDSFLLLVKCSKLESMPPLADVIMLFLSKFAGLSKVIEHFLSEYFNRLAFC